MLVQLTVSNFALIDQVDLRFDAGLTAITGETGSGKSILLGALGMLLGERADSRVIGHAGPKCIVEGVFDLTHLNLQAVFTEHDLDAESLTTLRREITTSGKSRAFINDTPVSLSTLRLIGEQLVDIHSQHENSVINDRVFQFAVVDAFAENEKERSAYSTAFQSWKNIRQELDECIRQEAQLRQDLDYFRFQWNELNEARLDETDVPALEQEAELLNHSEAIKSTLQQASDRLQDEPGGVIASLSAMRAALIKIADVNPKLSFFSERTESTLIELKDLASEIESFNESVEFNPSRVETIQERLSSVYRLLQKHRTETVQELITLRDDLAAKIGGYTSLDDRIASLKKQLDAAEHSLKEAAQTLHISRCKGAEHAIREVSSYFRELRLDHAELSIELTPSAEFGATGGDNIRYLFKANKGGQLQPIHSVASGGEISRVMLAVKAAIAHRRQLPVLVLDEIDQGVSGEAAVRIGSVLRRMSADLQVITITHMAAIAGKATQHLKVYKTTEDESTRTRVRPLQGEERVQELAEMISGAQVSKAALENARELLKL